MKAGRGIAVILSVQVLLFSLFVQVHAQETPSEQGLSKAIVEQLIGSPPPDANVPTSNGQLQLPRDHPAYGLKNGQPRAFRGVTVLVDPPVGLWQPRIAGVPEKFTVDLANQDFEMEPGRYEEIMRRKLANALASYYGEALPSDRQNQLKGLYFESISAGVSISRQLLEKSITSVAGREAYARLLAKTVLAEMAIFAGFREAQARRYRSWKGEKAPAGERVQTLLQIAFLDLLEGKYFMRDARRILDEQEKRSFGTEKSAQSWVSDFENVKWTSDSETISAQDGATPTGSLLSYTNETSHPAETYAWNARIFTAEHSVLSDSIETELNRITDLDWSAVAGDVGLVHVSVIGGIWRLTKQRVLQNVTDPTTGRVAEERVTRVAGQWYSWGVADGSASWLYSNDVLILKESIYFSSFEAAQKYLKGSRPILGGGYDPMQACSYSVGDYGSNWVCHQNSNAYAYTKWGTILVQYPTVFVFGLFSNYYNPLASGSLPISKSEDPIYHHRPIYGGVPGEWLFYESMPPYATYGGLLNPLMNGGGYGLDVYWNPTKQQWVLSNCSYVHRGIPFEGADDQPITLQYWW